MVLVDMGHLMVGVAVDPGVEQGDDDIANQHPHHYQTHIVAHFIRMQCLRQKVKAHHRGHHPGGK